jgi:tRNA(Phe) wybutosine-synthesizing methylase Tyw3
MVRGTTIKKMVPTTTEEKLEYALSIAESELDNAKYKMKCLRAEISKHENTLVECRINRDNLVEELRKFRLMYPDICKPPTR